MKELICQCRERLGEPPRSLSWLERARLFSLPPLFLLAGVGDALWRAYRDESLLLKQGRVVWGQLIQANQTLFSPGRIDAPGEVLYSPDSYFDDNLEALGDIAQKLASLKGTAPGHPDLAIFAAAITHERTRTFAWQAPAEITGGRPVLYSTMIFHRRDLPGGYLASGFFPVLAAPQRTGSIMILPLQYWPPRLVDIYGLIGDSGDDE